MARPSSPPLLAQIRTSHTPAEQTAALRALKNDLVGHQQKKEMWVRLGVVEPIVRIMTAPKDQGKQVGKQRHGYSIVSRSPTEEEMARLQALYVTGSLAHGGSSFLLPMSSANALPAILSNLCPASNPAQIVLAALRVLCNLTDSAALASNSHSYNTAMLAENVFLRPHLNSLCKILLQSSSSSLVQTQISLAASLIRKLCRDERHQSSLANAGVLDALATRLASVIVSQGLVLPGADVVARREGLQDSIPLPAAPNVDLAGVLGALAVIIANSKLRASQLVYSNAIVAVFPPPTATDFQSNRSTKAAWNALNTADLATHQPRFNAINYLIPSMPLDQSKNASALASAFPPLGTPGSFENLVQLGQVKNAVWPQSLTAEMDVGLREQSNAVNEPESALIPYLIWLTRSTKDHERLMAASVLTVLYRAGFTYKTGETALGLLVVPILVQLLNDERTAASWLTSTTGKTHDLLATDWIIKEQTPAVLAMLIVDSEYLQKSAYDAGIITKLSKMLKAAYNPVLTITETRPWSPIPQDDVDLKAAYPSQSSQLGESGQHPLLVHRIKIRESILRAIAALVPFKDEYRKALIDQGVVPYIVESLKTYPDRPSIRTGDKPEKANHNSEENKGQPLGFGINSISVLIAACGAVRHLSRSVSILRTTLIDNGVVMPVFNLLQHSDIDVQVAATAVVCNLVMDFSPMRETIFSAGVLKVLCKHAHSGNVKLRLNALWALKHLVQSAGNDVKKTCLEELGQGWLIQLICDDTEDEALLSSRSTLAPHSSNNDIDEDVVMDQLEEDEESRMADSIGALGHRHLGGFDSRESSVASRPSSSRGLHSSLGNARLAALQDLETNPERRARKDDIAVQEQGLDFIRNLIGGFNNVGMSETSEMIDFLFSALGQDQIFEILASKLRSKVIKPATRRSSSSLGEIKIVPPQPEIITAVEYILVNMAASVPRHRQLVIAQTELLKLLVPQFNNASKEVRLALCWLVINLTWVDDTNDSRACSQRAQELKKLGFLTKLEHLEQDTELDIRERAKTAVWQMKQGYDPVD